MAAADSTEIGYLYFAFCGYVVEVVNPESTL
jgi:hypothetical protein